MCGKRILNHLAVFFLVLPSKTIYFYFVSATSKYALIIKRNFTFYYCPSLSPVSWPSAKKGYLMSNLSFVSIFYLCVFFYIFTSSFPPISPVQSVKSCCEKYVCLVDLDLFVGVQFCIIILGLMLFILNSLCFCRVAYVTYCTNLCITNRKNTFKSGMNEYMLYWLLLALIVTESSFDINLANFLHFYLASSIRHNGPTLKFCRSTSHALSFVIYFFILGVAVTPATHILCLILTYFLCVKITLNTPFWVPFLLILLSNDILN